MRITTDHRTHPATARAGDRTLTSPPPRTGRGRLCAWTLAAAMAGIMAALGPTAAQAWVGEQDAGRLPPTVPAPARPAGSAGRTEEPTPGGPPRLEVKAEPIPGAYVLRVKVSGGRPAAVQVIPRGQALDLSLSIGGSSVSGTGGAAEARPGAATSQRSSAYHGSVHRRVPLPADADLGRVTREVSGDTLLLRVPRRPAPPGARPVAPARPAGTR